MVRAHIVDAHCRYQAAEYEQVLADLPSLSAAVDATRYGTVVGEHMEVLLAYTYAYVMASKLLTKGGVTDLAMVSADRAATASMEAESLVARALSAYQVVCALLRADQTDTADHLAITMASEVEPSAGLRAARTTALMSLVQ